MTGYAFTETSELGTRGRWRRRVEQQPLLAFFSLSYLISWTLWIPTLLVRVDTSPEPLVWVAVVCMYLGGFGPLVAAALAVRLAAGDVRAWARQIVAWRVSARWWVVAFGLPIAVTAVVAVLYIALGGPYDLEAIPPAAAYVFLFLFALVLSGGLNEEPAWRGFALPLLQERHSALTAGLVIGGVWAAWHLPLFFAPVAPHSSFPLVTQLLYFPSVVVWSLLLTWVFNSSRSVLVAMVMHAGLNTAGQWMPLDASRVVVDGVPQGGYLGMVSGLTLSVYLLVAVVVIGLFGRRRLARSKPPTSPVLGLAPEKAGRADTDLRHGSRSEG